MWAIIGGSGFEKFEDFEIIKDIYTNTPFGHTSSGLKKVLLNGKEILFLSRHGENHELLPSEINYRANIYALKKFGAKAILSISAVGSLKEEYKPGDMVIPFQYIDRTKSLRNHTYFGDGLIGHVSMAKPISMALVEQVEPITQKMSFQTHLNGTYVCIEGPGFSTLAESNYYRQIGATLIGMTNFPEYALAREAGMSYLPSCFVTDYDCWKQDVAHVTVEEVIRVMKANNKKAFEFAQKVIALDDPWLACDAEDSGMKTGLFMPLEAVPKAKREWVDLFMGKNA